MSIHVFVSFIFYFLFYQPDCLFKVDIDWEKRESTLGPVAKEPIRKL